MAAILAMLGLPRANPARFVARATAATLGPVVSAAAVELEELISAACADPRAQAAVSRALESDAAKRLVATFFDSSLFDEVITRLLESRQLWLLVEEIAESPSVTAAISRQGLGFADQVGAQVRHRSRNADAWLERAAHRLSRRNSQALSAAGEGVSGGTS